LFDEIRLPTEGCEVITRGLDLDVPPAEDR